MRIYGRACTRCCGSGYGQHGPCRACGGRGWVMTEREARRQALEAVRQGAVR